jgi:hypothetical protein
MVLTHSIGKVPFTSLLRDKPCAHQGVYDACLFLRQEKQAFQNCSHWEDLAMPTAPEIARAIMKKNFLSPDAVQATFGIKLPAEHFAQVPYSENVLRLCQHTHVLFAGAALSVNSIRRRSPINFVESEWYRNELFANEKKVSVRWYLHRKGPVPDSCFKSYDQQCSLLAKDEVVPAACEVTYLMSLYWSVHRERLLTDVYVRCLENDSNFHRVGAGYFGHEGWCIANHWTDGLQDDLGLASAWTPESLAT